ncbi:hypothetical protein ES708_02562 [subsurface metagenome]
MVNTMKTIVAKTMCIFLTLYLYSASTVIASDTVSNTIVVTTSMLEHAVRNVLPASETVKLVRMIPPGSCPGHFDLSPQIVPVLREAIIIIRHDYQGSLGDKITHLGINDVRTLTLSTPGSLVIPSHYAELTEKIAAILKREFPDRSDDLSLAVTQIRTSSLSSGKKILHRAEPWKNISVIASYQQKDFCEWLGFKVEGVINRAENMTPRDIIKLLSSNAEIVIGNLQEGAEAALSLGEKKSIPVAVLSNFPDAAGYGSGYDQLLEENVNRIEQAWRLR